jgi:hypothetical protein
MRRAFSSLLLTLSLLACGGGSGDDGGGDDDTPAADADPLAPDADPAAPDAAPPGTPDAGGPQYDYCVETCQSPADCVPAQTSALTDADNYACNAGRCQYKGCNSTAECQAVYMSNAYVCGTVSGNPLPACYESCNGPADCVIAGSTLYDTDNWACDGGKCRWTGCNSTAECQGAFMSQGYVCAASGAGFDTCWPTCSAPADCATASPVFDADNYECTGGRCQWTGCNSTSECAAANGGDWVCE